MKIENLRFIFFFFPIFSIHVFAQRVYKSDYVINNHQSINHSKKTQHNFLLENSFIGVNYKKDKFVIVIDTLESNSILLKKLITKNEYFVLSHNQDSIKCKELSCINSYVTDVKNDVNYYLTSSISLYKDQLFYIDLLKLTKCFILVAINSAKKREVTIFSYFNKKVRKYEISNHFEILGNNDSSLFILLTNKKTKVNGEKFKSGSVLRISSSGVRTLTVDTRDLKHENLTPIYFYNEDYSVQCKNISKLPTGNRIEVFYQLEIKYKNKILDSIIGMDHYDEYEQKTDVKYFDDQLHIFSPNFYKLCTKNDCYTWNINDWLDEIRLLKDRMHQYFLKGDTLYLTKEIQVLDSIGFNKKTNTTFNHIKLNSDDTFFKLIMAFNIKTNMFLGYPEIEFTTVASKRD